MDYTAKIDALDMIVNVLKQHEQNLDATVNRLQDLAEGENFSAPVVKHGHSLSVTIPVATIRRMGVEHGDRLKVNLRR